MTEREWQAQVIQFARLCGWKVAHFRSARTLRGWRTPVGADGEGWPDLFMTLGARCLAAELKVGKRQPAIAQENWLAALRLAGVEVYVWYPYQWDEIVEVLGR